ncbi:MAG: NAD-dependent epimerase/dehydratase family protein [Armatimonadetes bacterium]|nr:NAD-dependent epimerase/dehydratase family protein [Armatimonadota bacterium]
MRALVSMGRRVRMVSRSGRAPVPRDVEIAAADATDPSSARRVCRGAAVVYHCASAPYHQWPAKLPPIMAGIIDGAASAGAALVYGDNLYMYGPVSGPLTEDLPDRAPGPNGRTRASLARMVLAAHESGKLRATIGRGSDFFGPHALQSMAGERIFPRALARRPAQVLGNPDLLHTYTFLDDFARGLVTLGERPESLGQVWHIPSSETITTRQFVQLVFEEAGTAFRLSAAPTPAISLLALVNPTLRAVKEQLYQVTRPFVVDHTKYARAFGVHVTPHREAITQTLDWFRSAGRH